MQKGAQYQTVLELITEIFKDKEPADKIINTYLREHKYIGSSDRRFITEIVWTILRHRRRLTFDAQSSEPRRILLYFLRNEDFDVLCSDSKYSLAPLSKEEKIWLEKENENPYPPEVEAETPDWLYAKIKDMNLLKALNKPAPADLRINAMTREFIIKKLQKEGLFFRPTKYSPLGIRSTDRVNLHNCMTYQEGEVEVQDEASQIAAILADVQPNYKTIDYCCGAGGKSLTIAFLNENKGKIDVHDINWGRLEAIKDRSVRLKITNLNIIKELKDKDYERFIVDAPCSGSGTWRRSPDAKFRLTPYQLEELSKTQQEILDTAYEHTAKGGRIVYFTCSILPEENENVIQSFCTCHPDMKKINLKPLWEKKLGSTYPVKDEYMLHLNPLISGTDGFFVCVMEKI
ncbi:MAG: RsmB/NOP family class I SAM-dependent RNA methyltransferase [Alphaproteobacteria bacterium]|nr:RsmB/NOP family class I SAM-dependent RNA methyltransferase [Alphaproteobacteria bacterium]